MSEVVIEDISLNVSDSTTMPAFVARPKDSEKHPGILIFQDVYGLKSSLRDIAVRFAREGFITIAPELFHRNGKGFQGKYDDFESSRNHIQALTIEGMTLDLNSANEWLINDTRLISNEIASIGFCMGGKVSFLANTLLNLKAAISFYGGGVTGMLDHVPDIPAPQLMFLGGLDKYVDDNQINNISAALKSNSKNYVSVVFSNADNGFFCNSSSAFNTEAAMLSWSITLAFLNFYLKKS